MLVVFGVAAVVVLPALGLLYTLDQRSLLEEETESPDRPVADEQVEIVHGDQRAVVVEVGAGLRAYTAGGRELLDGYGAGRDEQVRAAGRC